jgi:hypothetical protein
MEAAATREFLPGREQPAHGTRAGEGGLREQLALMEFERIELFDTIDQQLFDLYSAAIEPIEQEPPQASAAVFAPAPPLVPEIVVPPRIDARIGIEPQSARGFRAAAILGVLLVGLGLASFGTWSLVGFLRGQGTLSDKAAVDGVVDRIIMAESGGNADARNKRSSAAGTAQFIDETWLEMIRAYRPDLAKTLSRADTLALRHQPAIAREIAMRFAERNAALLRRRGTVYLAHFAGGAGAVALLSAPTDADAATVMAKADASGKTKRETVVKANPFLARYTVADLKRWAERKMQARAFSLAELFSASVRK